MSFYTKLEAAAHRNDTLLCVGLDPTPKACPPHFLTPGSRSLTCRELPDGTDLQDLQGAVWRGTKCRHRKPPPTSFAVSNPTSPSTKPWVSPAWPSCATTISRRPARHPSSSRRQARRHRLRPLPHTRRACFEVLGADAVTLSPYLGQRQHYPLCGRLRGQRPLRPLSHLEPLCRSLPKADRTPTGQTP